MGVKFFARYSCTECGMTVDVKGIDWSQEQAAGGSGGMTYPHPPNWVCSYESGDFCPNCYARRCELEKRREGK